MGQRYRNLPVKTLFEIFMDEEARKYLSTIGRRGGKARGGAKADTARTNGKLGGRPKKHKRVARRHNEKLSD